VNTVKIYLTVDKYEGDNYALRVNKIETPIANDLSFTITYKLENEGSNTIPKFLASTYTSDFVPFPSAILSRTNTNDKSIDLLTLRVFYQNGVNPIKTFDIDKRFKTFESVNDSTKASFTITDLTPGGGNENVQYNLQQNTNRDNHAYAFISISTNNLGIV
jgi:hypothetical protein